MDLGLSGKTALVFGASGGLGRAIAEALAAEGANVALAGRSQASLAETARAIRPPARAISIVWDLAEIDCIADKVAEAQERIGPIDILVNMTGGPPPGPAAGHAPETWMSYFRSLVLSVIAITDAVLPSMRERRWGRVITSASSGVAAPIPNLGLSNSLRLALIGWSKTLAGEVAAHGITANIVVPGRIRTQRTASLDEAKAKREQRAVAEVTAESIRSIPLGRYGFPKEYADVVAFLASERASYVNGAQIRVDGGLIQGI